MTKQNVTYALAVALMLSGCLERELKPLNPCLVSGVVAEVSVANVDKVDILFMVDDSKSMEGEQLSLAREFPKLIRALATGDRDSNGVQDFTPVKDLHLGVVSSNLGLPGINIEGCEGVGDDGLLQNMSRAEQGECVGRSFPLPYLTYDQSQGGDPDLFAEDFTCLALLGVKGCGFEQQLESALKAVWPGNDNSRVFLGQSGLTPGNGGAGFPNGEFLRDDSLIAIVLVTDEEDCSSRRLNHFDPNGPDPNLNTRCFYESQRPDNNLFAVQRYIDSFKALRPGRENLVIFAGIVGVPERLVTEEAMAGFDRTTLEGSNAFFDSLLNDPDLKERVDQGDPNLNYDASIIPSCSRPTVVNGMEQTSDAFPPRRIIEVAKGFGPNGVIQSICQDDFGPAIDAIIEVIAAQIGDVCLPRPLVRNSEGTVDCNVIWELPPATTGDAPTRCDERNYLAPPDATRAAVTEDGGAVCVVTQLPVADKTVPMGDGWYYDDFSSSTLEECKAYPTPQRITFSTMATPPNGVTVKLECLNETQSLPNTRMDLARDVEQPSVGSPCEKAKLRGQEISGDDACVVLLAAPVDGSVEDRGMFCHRGTRVCVERCSTDAECPAAWVCDTRGDSITLAGGAFCVNPTCGGGE